MRLPANHPVVVLKRAVQRERHQRIFPNPKPAKEVPLKVVKKVQHGTWSLEPTPVGLVTCSARPRVQLVKPGANVRMLGSIHAVSDQHFRIVHGKLPIHRHEPGDSHAQFVIVEQALGLTIESPQGFECFDDRQATEKRLSEAVRHVPVHSQSCQRQS